MARFIFPTYVSRFFVFFVIIKCYSSFLCDFRDVQFSIDFVFYSFVFFMFFLVFCSCFVVIFSHCVVLRHFYVSSFFVFVIFHHFPFSSSFVISLVFLRR